MDKVYRYFTIKDEVFTMASRVEGDFGIQEIQTSASPNGDVIIQRSTPNSAPPSFEFRVGEMQYFLQVFSMFNPKFQTDYGLQETQQETQKEF